MALNSRRLRSLVFWGSLLGLAGLACYRWLWLQRPEPPLPEPSSRQPFILQRARQAISVQRFLEQQYDVGVCHNGKPIMGTAVADERLCNPITCLFSEAFQENIDLEFNTLTPLPAVARSTACPLPAGGQRPSTGTVQIAFILTMHNAVKTAAQCLLELFRTAHEAFSAEFVVVNDASTEDTFYMDELVARLRLYFGVRVKYLNFKKSVGYGVANMKGVEASDSQYIAFINSDMFVAPGWLTALLETFRLRPRVGLVGPLFVGANNLVTEAGGVVFSDGTAGNYGRGRWVDHEVSFARPVDYVSAACVIMKRTVLKEFGGFDRLFGRGYYEDTDLSMTLYAHGYQVIFQPLSVVYHQEGTTLGTDASRTKQNLMSTNHRIFFSKWATQLAAKHCASTAPSGASPMQRAYRHRLSPRMLWVDDIVPEPDHDSGSVRTAMLLRILVDEGYDVTYQASVPRDASYVKLTRFAGVDVLPILSPEQWRAQNRGCAYQIIVVARRYVYQAWIQAVKAVCPGVPIIYDTVDLHFLRETRDKLSTARPTTDQLDFKDLSVDHILNYLDGPSADPDIHNKRDVELSIVDDSAATLVVSSQEVHVLAHYRPQAKVYLVSNIHEFEASRTTCEGRSGVLFVGNFNHQPNQQAVRFLITEVLPQITRQASPDTDVTIHIVGANVVPEDLKQLFAQHSRNVVFHGWLSNELLRVLYYRVRVAVAPLLSGAGVKGKVNQAMKYGVPVVATPVATEGMHLKDGVDCVVARSAKEFADGILQLHKNCSLFDKLAANGFANLRTHFSVETAKETMLKVLAGVGIEKQLQC